MDLLMAALPDWMLLNAVQLEPWAGTSATGDVFGPAVELACLVEQRRKLVRAADGSEVVSETTVYAQLDAVAAVPARSRVTLPDGRQTKVLQAKRRDGAGLPTPDHWELVCE